jgi:hypothetical protein
MRGIFADAHSVERAVHEEHRDEDEHAEAVV